MKKCTKCGNAKVLSEFYLKYGAPDSMCKECRRNAQKEYYRKHEQQGKDNSRKWRAQNKERASFLHKRWMKEHKEEYREKYKGYTRKYRQTHPNVSMKSQIVRLLRIIMAPGSFTDDEWKEMFIRAGGKCSECGTSENLTVDHIMPISKGGSNTIDNLQILCRKHNSAKRDRIIVKS